MKKKFKTKKPIQKLNPMLWLGSVLIVLLLSISVGFSALTTSLSINGRSALIPVGMIRVMQYKQNNLFQATETSKTFSPDTINSIVTINNYDGEATYDVSIRNLGQIDKVLDDIVEEIFTNAECTYELNGFSIGEVIEAGETKNFTITFKYKDDVLTPIDTNLNAKLKFVFKDYEELIDIAYFIPYDGTVNLMGFDKTNITEFKRSNLTEEQVLQKSGVQLISNESDDQYNSTRPIYGYVENNIFYWWSSADIVYFHPNTLKAFSKITNLTTVDLTGTSTEKVENFAHWFDTSRNLKRIIGKLDTSGLKLQYNPNFNYATDSNENTTSGYGLTYLFNDCNNLEEVDLSGIVTTNASDMKRMFGGCKKLPNIDISHFDTSNVKSMYWMFRNNNVMTEIDLSSFDTSKVENMFGMFLSSTNLQTITFGEHFNTSNVKKFDRMFYDLKNLKTIYAQIDFIRQTNSTSTTMFNNNSKLIGGRDTDYQTKFSNSNPKDKTYAQISNVSQPGYFTFDGLHLRYTIIYMLDGGVASNPNTYTDESNFTLNHPIKPGYTFIGWTGSNGNTPELDVTIDENYVGNLEFTANYTRNYYTVIYNANGGTGHMDDQIVYYDEPSNLNANTFTKQGNQFVNWNTAADGSGTSIINQKEIKNLIDSGTIALYAQWYNPNQSSQLVFNVPGPCNFDGVNTNISGSNCKAYGNDNSINTDIKLFDSENRLKDFMLSFNLDYDASNQEANQSTVINTFSEASTTNNPGLVFRKSSNTTFELIARDDAGTVNVKLDATNLNKFKIVRQNNKVCYSTNDGNYKFLYDFSNSTVIFDTPLRLGSSNDKNGNVWRTINGTLSNISLYLGSLGDTIICDETMR